MTRLEATPTPGLLVWARASAGMPIEVAAKKAAVKADQLRSWENGGARPSIAQLRKLATIYRRPLAVFYLSEPPARFQPMHDFRRLPLETSTPEDSPKLAFEIRRAYDRREWALELMEGIGESPPAFGTTLTVGSDIEEGGTRLRKALGASLSEGTAWGTGHEAFKQWRLLLEGAGIITFQATELDLHEARGFSISMKPLPVVVTNIKDAPRARIFTLLHELTHVMLDDGGICDLHDGGLEAFCNRVAGAALFPKQELLRTEVVRQHRRGDPKWSDLELKDLSHRFGGSREAALVRLLTLGLTTQIFYNQRRKQFLDEYKTKQSTGFAPPHVVALSSAGPLFTNLVIESLNREQITASDVSDYLQVRVKHLREVRAESPWTT